jgi:hypothetical protein
MTKITKRLYQGDSVCIFIDKYEKMPFATNIDTPEEAAEKRCGISKPYQQYLVTKHKI